MLLKTICGWCKWAENIAKLDHEILYVLFYCTLKRRCFQAHMALIWTKYLNWDFEFSKTSLWGTNNPDWVIPTWNFLLSMCIRIFNMQARLTQSVFTLNFVTWAHDDEVLSTWSDAGESCQPAFQRESVRHWKFSRADCRFKQAKDELTGPRGALCHHQGSHQAFARGIFPENCVAAPHGSPD